MSYDDEFDEFDFFDEPNYVYADGEYHFIYDDFDDPEDMIQEPPETQIDYSLFETIDRIKSFSKRVEKGVLTKSQAVRQLVDLLQSFPSGHRLLQSVYWEGLQQLTKLNHREEWLFEFLEHTLVSFKDPYIKEQAIYPLWRLFPLKCIEPIYHLINQEYHGLYAFALGTCFGYEINYIGLSQREHLRLDKQFIDEFRQLREEILNLYN